MDPIKVYNLDQFGVVVDANPIGGTEGELTKAQNAIADPLGELGSIRVRPGLKPFNAIAATGVIKGGVSIPIDLGSAGPDFQNPFIDTPVTAVEFYRPTYTLTGINIPLFDDNSDWTLFPDIDFGPYPDDALLGARGAITEPLSDLADFNDVFNSPEAPSGNPFDVNRGTGAGGSQTRPSPLSASTPSALYTLTVVGSGTSWYVGLNTTLTQHFDNSSTYPNPATLLFPSVGLRTTSPLSDWHTGGSTSALRGRSMTTLNGAILYVQS